MAYLALYRRYRPQDFDSVVGQDYITKILKNQILSDRVGHAYLFSGIRGTGKTSIAKIFARAINCPQSADGNPCNQCATCQEIEQSGVMDIIEIDAASNRGVDEIREIREKVKYPPTLGKYKVYIIDEVHMLTKEAFNALLKTLEEPPAHAVFILATTEPNKLPMTILSRCQRFDIRPIPQNLIIQQIKKILGDIGVKMTDDAIEFVAWRGDNSMRDALSLLDQIIDLKPIGETITYEDVLDFTGMVDEDFTADILSAVLSGDAGVVLERLKTLREAGKDSALVMGQIIEYGRRVLIAKTAPEKAAGILALPQTVVDRLKEKGEQADGARLCQFVDTLMEERTKLRYSGLGDVVLEMALLKLTTPHVFAQKAPVAEADSKKQTLKRPEVVTLSAAKPEASSSRVMPEVLPESPETPPFPEDVPFPDEPAEIEDYVPEIPDYLKVEKQRPSVQATAKSMEVAPPVREEVSAPDLQEKPAPAVAVSGINPVEVHHRLLAICEKRRPLLGRAISGAQLRLAAEGYMVITHCEEIDVAQMKRERNLQFIRECLEEITHKSFTVSVEKNEKCYEDMSVLEKTREIINDEKIPVIEVNLQNK